MRIRPPFFLLFFARLIAETIPFQKQYQNDDKRNNLSNRNTYKLQFVDARICNNVKNVDERVIHKMICHRTIE